MVPWLCWGLSLELGDSDCHSKGEAEPGQIAGQELEPTSMWAGMSPRPREGINGMRGQWRIGYLGQYREELGTKARPGWSFMQRSSWLKARVNAHGNKGWTQARILSLVRESKGKRQEPGMKLG